LTRRKKALVWDDEIEISDGVQEEDDDEDPANPLLSPKLSIASVPLPGRARSQSSSSDFPPPMLRTSTDASGVLRPVPFVSKFQRVHPGTTGVTALEHLERLDAVEASLQRLAVHQEEVEEELEVDVGESSSQIPPIIVQQTTPSGSGLPPASPFSPPGSPLPTVHEVPSSGDSDVAEEDLVALSKSTSHVEGTPRGHTRWASQGRGLDWLQEGNGPRTAIVEVRHPFTLFLMALLTPIQRLEMVEKTPLCSFW